MNRDQAQERIRQHVGARIVRAWKGHGSALFLDLENEPVTKSIFAGYYWRSEREGVIEAGWGDPNPAIVEFCKTLDGMTIAAITISDGVPELVVELADGRSIRTITHDEPLWHVNVGPKLYVFVDESWTFRCDNDPRYDDDELERMEYELASAAHKRWRSTVTTDPTLFCQLCRFYRRIDGSGHLIDWGVCISPKSPHDGKAVNCHHTCKEHEIDESNAPSE
ncbi:MAG: DUF3027 domain-containing protein [Bacteroidetes bacterium]|nr:DUF3027 domain-containing protein [Bacteroidota bacterium]